MQDLLSSVEKVTSIVKEISSASDEQATGIDQVNLAVTQMDAVTQQNASLVEQAAAAAASLQEQARQLAQAVAVFKIAARPDIILEMQESRAVGQRPVSAQEELAHSTPLDPGAAASLRLA